MQVFKLLFQAGARWAGRGILQKETPEVLCLEELGTPSGSFSKWGLTVVSSKLLPQRFFWTQLALARGYSGWLELAGAP